MTPTLRLTFPLVFLSLAALFANENVSAQTSNSPDRSVALATPDSPQVDASVWGPLSQLVGHDWVSSSFLSVRWTIVGEEMKASWSDEYGSSPFDMIITKGRKPGLLSMRIPDGDFQGEYTGKRDGDELYFVQNRLMRRNLFTFNMAEPGIASLMGPHLYSLDGQLFYINEPAPELVANRAIWGVYLDLIDKTWLLRGVTDAMPSKFTFRWLVPGKVIAEIGYQKSGKHMPDAVRHVRALPNGKLIVVYGEWTHLFPAEGTLAPNGDIAFVTLKKRMFSFDWSYQKQADGNVKMPMSVLEKSDPVFVPISAEEEKEIQDVYDQQRWAEIQRKRERLSRFIDATNAMGGALSEAQHAADASAAQSRANLDATLARIEASQRSTQSPAGSHGVPKSSTTSLPVAAPPATQAPTTPEPVSTQSTSQQERSPASNPSNCRTIDAPPKQSMGFSRASEQDARDKAMANTKQCKIVGEMYCTTNRDFEGVKDGRIIKGERHWDCRVMYHCGETRQHCEVKPQAGSAQ